MEGPDRITKLDGRIRALEALVLEMPGLTAGMIQAAKERLRAGVLRQGGQMAEVRLRLSGYLDQPAEDALDDLAYALESRNRQQGRRRR
jgi:hypothetical protein